MKHNVRVARNSSVFPMAHGECVYIVDIDSTILDIKHRVHHVQKEEPDFETFYSLQHLDTVFPAMGKTLRVLSCACRIVLVTGRPVEYLNVTREVLAAGGVDFDFMYMAKSHDNVDVLLQKAEALQDLLSRGASIVAAFEDRPRLVEMYRNAGVHTFACDGSNWRYLNSDAVRAALSEALLDAPVDVNMAHKAMMKLIGDLP